jgi:hypothetical protein
VVERIDSNVVRAELVGMISLLTIFQVTGLVGMMSRITSLHVIILQLLGC